MRFYIYLYLFHWLQEWNWLTFPSYYICTLCKCYCFHFMSQNEYWVSEYFHCFSFTTHYPSLPVSDLRMLYYQLKQQLWNLMASSCPLLHTQLILEVLELTKSVTDVIHCAYTWNTSVFISHTQLVAHNIWDLVCSLCSVLKKYVIGTWTGMNSTEVWGVSN